jgi:pilus assembly protein TadC
VILQIALAGGLAGVALVAAVLVLVPKRPALGSARRPAPFSADPGAPAGAYEQIGARLLRWAARLLRVSARDLALLKRSPAQHTGRQAVLSVVMFVFPQVLAAVMALWGVPLPFALPVGLSLFLAVAVWMGADVEARRDAAAKRAEFRVATASFLERAALARGAGLGAVDALYRTAEVGDGWAFDRIRQALEQARLSAVSPWQALAELAEEVGVKELARPAQTFQLAGEESASVYDTLRAQSRAIRTAILTEARAKANAASERLVIPVTGLTITFVLVIGYPAVVRIVGL